MNVFQKSFYYKAKLKLVVIVFLVLLLILVLIVLLLVLLLVLVLILVLIVVLLVVLIIVLIVHFFHFLSPVSIVSESKKNIRWSILFSKKITTKNAVKPSFLLEFLFEKWYNNIYLT